MAPAARPLKRRPSSSARVAGRCWTSVSGASLNFHAHRHLFAARFGGLERAEMIHGPIGKHCAAVNKLTGNGTRSEEHTSELQSRLHLVCRLLLEKKKNTKINSVCCVNSGPFGSSLLNMGLHADARAHMNAHPAELEHTPLDRLVVFMQFEHRHVI